MSVRDSFKEATFYSLSLMFGAIGGFIGLILTFMLEGWIPVPVGIASGVFAALAISYHTVKTQRDAAHVEIRQLKSGKANPQIVEALLPKLQFAIHEIANRVKESDTREWKDRFRAWEHETKALLETLKCTPLEISSFWDYTHADLQALGTLYPANPKIDQRLRWAQFRIRALRRIINAYADAPVLGNE